MPLDPKKLKILEIRLPEWSQSLEMLESHDISNDAKIHYMETLNYILEIVKDLYNSSRNVLDNLQQ